MGAYRYVRIYAYLWTGTDCLLAPSSPVFPSCRREELIFLPVQWEMGACGWGGHCGWGVGHSGGSEQRLLSRIITDAFRRAEE